MRERYRGKKDPLKGKDRRAIAVLRTLGEDSLADAVQQLRDQNAGLLRMARRRDAHEARLKARIEEADDQHVEGAAV